MRLRQASLLAVLLLFGAAACADLEVTNPNQPDRARVGATAADQESLVAGAFRQWLVADTDPDGAGPILSTQAFQHSAWPANFGMVFYSAIPRRAFNNDQAREFYNQIAHAWTQNYRGAAGVANALHALDRPDMTLGEDEPRARAFGRFMQGLTHGHIALLFDRGPAIDETTPRDEADILNPTEILEYQALMARAIGYLDDAVTLSTANTFSIPASWFTATTSNTQLAAYARAMRAMYRANVARTPAEAQQVNWALVKADAEAAAPWFIEWNWPTWTHWNWVYFTFTGWGQENYFVMGMADQSGNYQTWLSQPVLQREPVLGGQDILIITPDTRFPQGATVAAQQTNHGAHIRAAANPGAQWSRPDRGTWRWSYYHWRPAEYTAPGLTAPDAGYGDFGALPHISADYLRLLRAEAHFMLNEFQQAAELINVSRTQFGLNATNAAGLNTSCVPKLPDGSCGGLFEMLKWEKRLMTKFQAPYTAPWYFDGRRWGDLMQGTPIHYPMPAREAFLEGIEPYTFGGALGGSAPVGTYGY